MVLNIGPQHPSTHGVLRLRLVLDGERIAAAEPVVGYMHRGAEKLFEARDYRQIIVLANRHDWLSAFSNELGVVLGRRADARHGGARARGVDAHPARRAEPGAQPPDVPRLVSAGAGRRSRRSSTPSASARSSSTSWRRSPAAGCTTCSTASAASRRTCPPAGSTGPARPWPPCAAGWTPSTSWCSATRSSGPAPAASACLARELVHAYGVSGPDRARLRRRLRPAPRRAVPGVRRAAGRPAGGHPHGGRLPGPVRGACWSRCTTPSTSPTPASTGWPSCRRGPINQRLPKVLKAPEGHTYAWTENPLGHQRLLPGLQGREDAVAAEAALGVVQQHPGAHRAAARARWSPTWWRSWARCSSSSATSTSSDK